MSRYRSLPHLAEQIEGVARAGKQVVLTPETARLVAAALKAFSTNPKADTIAAAVCVSRQRCTEPCFRCSGIANLVQQIYENPERAFMPEFKSDKR